MHSQMLFVILPCYVLFGVVDAISIEGSPLTTYSPCGSRLLYFTKQSPTQWDATLDVMYQSIEADVKISFEEDFSITWNPNYADKVTLRETGNNTIRIRVVPEHKQQIFSIKLNNDTVPTVFELIVNDVLICDDNTRESETQHLTSEFPYHLNSEVCGTRSRATEELYSVRTEAGDRDWPWHTGIYNYVDGVDSTFSGTIVSATTVVTTAYRIYNRPASLFNVVAGTNVLTDLHHPGRQERQAIKLIFHPEYRYPKYESGSIALIKVNEFIFNMYVQPVCVWGPQYDRNSIVGETGVVAGFGIGLNNTVNKSKQLRSTDTIIRKKTDCPNYPNERFFCAGFGETSNLNPSDGDGGSGLVIPTVVNGHVKWYLRGIFVACDIIGEHCNTKKYVGYTDVAGYYEWIDWHVMFF